MYLTNEVAAQATKIFNALTSVEVHDINRANYPELPVLTFSSLQAKDHFDVNEWGEAIDCVIRKKNIRAHFDLQIHGTRIVARTNINHDTAILVVIMTWNWLTSRLLKEATFDAAILNAATAPDEIAAK